MSNVKSRLHKLLTVGCVIGLIIMVGAIDASASPDDHGTGFFIEEAKYTESTTAFGTLWYDSGWDLVGVAPDAFPKVYTHNVGGNPDDYLVSLECTDFSELGVYDCTNHGFNVNAHWFGLTNSTIIVWVPGSGLPDYIRVRIYTKPTIYNSGWHTILSRPDPISLSFPLGRKFNLDNLVVQLDCRDDTELGTYDCTNQNFNIDAHWYNLGLTDIKVYVEKGSRPDAVRVRFLSETPAYNSGWHTIGIRPDDIVIPFAHNLGGNINEYIVKLDCRDNTELGSYDCTNQFFNKGAHWYGMTNTNIHLFVSGGSIPDDVRVRIWQQDLSIPVKSYLPLILNIYACEP